MTACPMAWARWLFPLPGGPMKSPSSRRPMKPAVARSKTRARFILGLNWKSKLSQSLVGIAETGLLAPPLQQALAAAGQLVRHQDRDQVDGGHGFALGLQQARLQYSGHAAQAQLA